jgi:hypothetical protein
MSLWDRAEMYKRKFASSPSLISGWAPVIIALLWIVYTVGVDVWLALPVNHHKPAQTLTFPALNQQSILENPPAGAISARRLKPEAGCLERRWDGEYKKVWAHGPYYHYH